MTGKDVYRSFQKVRETLGTSLLISDAITSNSAIMRDKRTSDDLAKSIYRFKDETRIMQTQQLLGISRIPSQHLEKS